MLSQRQELILGLVIDAYLDTGRPVGSKTIVESSELSWGPSTVRAELAALEAAGYLTHPHTSAGRVPTDFGYRRYVESIMLKPVSRPPSVAVEPDETKFRREVDDAMRETTTALSHMTDLLALVVAPPLGTATIHRVEALLLQPEVVMVVAITSSGDVTKRAFTFQSPVDPGLVEWASSYLNESLVGIDVGARRIASKLADPGLGPVEAEFIDRLSAALIDLEQGQDTLYVEGAGRLLDERRSQDLPQIDQLMTALEQRASVLRMMRSAIDERSVFLWIGGENPQPELRSVSVVGANYGLGHRNLGSVGVVGPTRMDYETAIASVSEAARELSHYFENVYA
ncbi:MAG: heat-inducible transcriptional repressor HrcA [Solirubrobacterales bacterium]